MIRESFCSADRNSWAAFWACWILLQGSKGHSTEPTPQVSHSIRALTNTHSLSQSQSHIHRHSHRYTLAFTHSESCCHSGKRRRIVLYAPHVQLLDTHRVVLLSQPEGQMPAEAGIPQAWVLGIDPGHRSWIEV